MGKTAERDAVTNEWKGMAHPNHPQMTIRARRTGPSRPLAAVVANRWFSDMQTKWRRNLKGARPALFFCCRDNCKAYAVNRTEKKWVSGDRLGF